MSHEEFCIQKCPRASNQARTYNKCHTVTRCPRSRATGLMCHTCHMVFTGKIREKMGKCRFRDFRDLAQGEIRNDLRVRLRDGDQGRAAVRARPSAPAQGEPGAAELLDALRLRAALHGPPG